MKFSGLIIASVSAFQGEADKNGKQPVFLNILGGKSPNRNILAGTVAENIGLEIGKTYLLQCREIEADEQYGRRFSWTKVSEMGALEVLQATAITGKAEMFNVGEAVEAPATHEVEAA